MEIFVDPYAPGPWCMLPKATFRLNALERAIYSTVAYRDVFDFTPTLDEIHRYLHWIRCGRDDVRQAIENGPLLKQHLATDGESFALRGRAHLLGMRARRRIIVTKFWPIAMRYARFLANLPHVVMVGLTGSFAAQNIDAGSDIDFMILTDAGKMWRTRRLALLSALVDRKFGRGKLCPNFVLSAGAMTLLRQSLYDAQELSQMIPLFGRIAYDELRRANCWSEAYLPNAGGAPDADRCFDRPPFPAVRRIVEWGTNSVMGRLVEKFESDRKIRSFYSTDRFNGGWPEATLHNHTCRDYIRRGIEEAWRRRLDALAEAEAAN
jgi:hypothetical protein